MWQSAMMQPSLWRSNETMVDTQSLGESQCLRSRPKCLMPYRTCIAFWMALRWYRIFARPPFGPFEGLKEKREVQHFIHQYHYRMRSPPCTPRARARRPSAQRRRRPAWRDCCRRCGARCRWCFRGEPLPLRSNSLPPAWVGGRARCSRWAARRSPRTLSAPPRPRAPAGRPACHCIRLAALRCISSLPIACTTQVQHCWPAWL